MNYRIVLEPNIKVDEWIEAGAYVEYPSGEIKKVTGYLKDGRIIVYIADEDIPKDGAYIFQGYIYNGSEYNYISSPAVLFLRRGGCYDKE